MALNLSSPARRQEAEAIFEAALDRPPGERSAHVDAACGDDSELRAAVTRLLAADAEAETEGFLGKPAIEDLRRQRPTAGSPRTPARGDVAAGDGEPRFVPGHLLGERYRIVHLLGRGGMGEVYRADDLKLRQPVALKFLPPGLTASRVAGERFLDEARLARRVTHPRICRIYDIGEAEGLLFLSMELVEGETLAELLRRIGRLPPERAVELAVEICAGLAAAHAQEILHRDLKPANLLLDADGHVRISDFGLASLVDSVRGPEVRSGTLAYMAPEQHLGREVTKRSDIYALGLVIYEMLAGERPFGGRGSELARQHCEATPEPPSRRVAGIDPAIERLVLRCLAKDPADRPASVDAVRAALRADAELPEGAFLRVVGPGASARGPSVLDAALSEMGDLPQESTGRVLRQSTEGGTSYRGPGGAAIELPVLTVVAHPDARRIGQVAILGGLGAGSEQEALLSRGEPAFGPPGEAAERPLAEPRLSRRPLRWRRDQAAGTCHLDCGGTSTRVLVDGELVRGARDFSPEALARGIVLVLAERVALVLRSTEPFPSRQLPSFGMVGECDAMVHLRRDVERVSDVDAAVLLRGETGTGKELVARAIHDASPRRGGPFVVADVAALSPGTAPSALVGSAEGGTLFLDRLGEAPSEIQALLLRASETDTVRILAATDVDLEAAVAGGRFPEALLHRLSGYEILVPPLRQRREDFGRLVYHFLAEELDAVGEIHRLMIPGGGKPWLPAELIAELAMHDWPGNVRQLRNVARQLIVANRGGADFRIPTQVERLLRG